MNVLSSIQSAMPLLGSIVNIYVVVWNSNCENFHGYFIFIDFIIIDRSVMNPNFSVCTLISAKKRTSCTCVAILVE